MAFQAMKSLDIESVVKLICGGTDGPQLYTWGSLARIS